jgi:lipopolysaccharide transport system permease protein
LTAKVENKEQAARMKFFRNSVRARYLILQFLNRQIRRRYRGSIFGLLSSLITPLTMLLIYTLVFGIIFQGRFGNSENETRIDFALTLFCGLNLFNLFSGVITQSPKLILEHPNLVKKVVFPLEVLPLVATLDELLHCLIAFVPLIVAVAISHIVLPWSFCYLPLFLFPLVLLAVGGSLILSSLGVFVRDIQQMTIPFITILMYGSAVFYPLSIIPQPIRRIMQLNPLATLIDEGRKSIILGILPDFLSLAIVSAAAFLFVCFAAWFFEKSKPAFADVI